MTSRFGLFIVVAVALAVAAFAVRPPAPATADSPESMFSAARAMPDVRQIARAPHPTGSTENRRVRGYLLRRLEALGLEVEVQRAQPIRTADAGWATGARVENLIATLPGEDRTAPAVVLMSHYDSAVGSPGAADDAAGVAASLEVMRALQAESGRRERDLILVITDAEEQGLLGAQAFFDGPAQQLRIGAVINLETRGASGRAFMFQTGPSNGELMALYAREVRQPATTSLAALLYSILPNDTDFTHALGTGLTGFNIAFIDAPFHYHAVTSTPETLDPGSLQHMGSQALDLSRGLIGADVLPNRAPDTVFSDVFGLFTLVYPTWAGWALLLVTGGLIAGLVARAPRSEGSRRKSTLIGAGAAVGILLLGSGLARAILVTTGASADFVEIRPLLGRLAWFEAALFLATLAASLLVGRLAIRSWGNGHHAPAPDGIALGVLTLGLAVTLALQIVAPAAALLTGWPTLIGATALLMRRRGGPAGGWAALGLSAIGMGYVFTLIHAFFLGVGATMPEAIGALGLVALLCVAPLWSRYIVQPRSLAIAGICLALAFGIGGWLRLGPQRSPDFPRFNQVLFITEPGVGTRIVSSMPDLDEWSRRVLTSNGGTITERAEPALWLDRVDSAPARDVDAPTIRISRSHLADGRVAFHLEAPSTARELRLTLSASHRLDDLSVQGQPVRPAVDGEPTRVRWSDPHGGVTVAVRPSTSDPVRLDWAVLIDGWPAGARPLPPREADLAPWGASDGHVVIGQETLIAGRRD